MSALSSARLPVVGLSVLLLAVACNSGSSSNKALPGARAVKVALTDKGCDLSTSSIPAGPVTFTVSNAASAAVSEAELVSGSKILGEKENIAAGLSGTFSLNLTSGSYAMRCPGGSGPQDQTFTVTAAVTDVSSPAVGGDAAQLAAATAGYQTYVKQQVALQVSATKAFTNAVRSGNLAAAAAAYPAARVQYERIEPVAESFGDIDPDIDARIADVPSFAAWTGYHRLEYAIFKAKSLKGTATFANKLDADVARLNTLVQTVTFQPAELANGASDLLDEVGKSKITGEEERYSDIDLIDFQANIDGAQKAFELLTPALQIRNAQMVTQINTAFTAVNDALKAYRTGTGPTDFKLYSAVPVAQHRVLSGLVDALAEPLSKVAGIVVTT